MCLTYGRDTRFNVSGFECRGSRTIGGKDLAALVLHLLDLVLDCGDNVIEFLDVFQEIADVQEGVAIEADFDEGRLHAGKHACDTAFVDAAD